MEQREEIPILQMGQGFKMGQTEGHSQNETTDRAFFVPEIQTSFSPV
jgi:hypothetical protein